MATRNAGAPRPLAADPSSLPSTPSTPVRLPLLRGGPPARLACPPPARSACQHHTIRLRVAASSVEMGAKKKPKKKPVKKQACRPPHRPAPPTPVTTLRPIPDPPAHPLCTTATPGEGAERRQRALLPRGHQGLHRRPQRLRLQDRPLELEHHPHGVACRMVAALSGLRTAHGTARCLAGSHVRELSRPALCVLSLACLKRLIDYDLKRESQTTDK